MAGAYRIDALPQNAWSLSRERPFMPIPESFSAPGSTLVAYAGGAYAVQLPRATNEGFSKPNLP